jgi:hypothetical protein
MSSAPPPPLALGTDQPVPGRGFCDPAHTAGDLGVLAALRHALRRRAGRGRAGAARFSDDIGKHSVTVPDWEALGRPLPVALVGFFGQSREHVNHSPIVALEHRIVARAAASRGLLAYHNAELDDNRWGNMVVFSSRAAVGDLAPDPLHLRAVACAPAHYESLRLHRGSLTDGLFGESDILLDETLYLDFGDEPAWRGLRVYARDTPH